MPGGGFAPSDDFDGTRPAGTDYGYDIDRWCTSNLQHTCNAYAIEHYEMSDDPDESEDDFGRHDFITLKQQASKPDLTSSTNRTGFYSKAAGVYLEKANGTEIQILDFTTERSGVDNDVPSGEIILFEKDTAVTGYTLQTDKNDMGVYITKGSVAGGEAGASDKSGGTWTIAGLTADSHTHSMNSHTHSVPRDGWGTGASSPPYYAGRLQVSPASGGPWYLAPGSNTSGTPSTANTLTASTDGVTSAGTWRLPGRNFTRQARN